MLFRSGISLDYEGTAPDIGAFEFTGSTPPAEASSVLSILPLML